MLSLSIQVVTSVCQQFSNRQPGHLSTTTRQNRLTLCCYMLLAFVDAGIRGAGVIATRNCGRRPGQLVIVK